MGHSGPIVTPEADASRGFAKNRHDRGRGGGRRQFRQIRRLLSVP
jgi:hypothetical protein